MSATKQKERLERVKDAIKRSSSLSDEEKSNSLRRIEEWIQEDKASGIIYEELLEISNKIKPILAELGII